MINRAKLAMQHILGEKLTSKPTVLVVVIPCLNEAQTIGDVIESIPKKIEIFANNNVNSDFKLFNVKSFNNNLCGNWISYLCYNSVINLFS